MLLNILYRFGLRKILGALLLFIGCGGGDAEQNGEAEVAVASETY